MMNKMKITKLTLIPVSLPDIVPKREVVFSEPSETVVSHITGYIDESDKRIPGNVGLEMVSRSGMIGLTSVVDGVNTTEMAYQYVMKMETIESSSTLHTVISGYTSGYGLMDDMLNEEIVFIPTSILEYNVTSSGRVINRGSSTVYPKEVYKNENTNRMHSKFLCTASSLATSISSMDSIDSGIDTSSVDYSAILGNSNMSSDPMDANPTLLIFRMNNEFNKKLLSNNSDISGAIGELMGNIVPRDLLSYGAIQSIINDISSRKQSIVLTVSEINDYLDEYLNYTLDDVTDVLGDMPMDISEYSDMNESTELSIMAYAIMDYTSSIMSICGMSRISFQMTNLMDEGLDDGVNILDTGFLDDNQIEEYYDSNIATANSLLLSTILRLIDQGGAEVLIAFSMPDGVTAVLELNYNGDRDVFTYPISLMPHNSSLVMSYENHKNNIDVMRNIIALTP